MDPVSIAAAAPAAVTATAHVFHAVHALGAGAQALATQLITQSAPGVDRALVMHGGIAAALGLAFSQTNQAGIEHNLASKSWMPQGLKPYLPALVSGAVAAVGMHFGISTADATSFAAALTMGTHFVNSSQVLASVAKDPAAAVITLEQAVKVIADAAAAKKAAGQ